MLKTRCPGCNIEVLVYAGLEGAAYICNNNHKFKLANTESEDKNLEKVN